MTNEETLRVALLDLLIQMPGNHFKDYWRCWRSDHEI